VIREVLGAAILESQKAVDKLLDDGGGVILFMVPDVECDDAWRTAVAGLHGLTRAIAKEYGRVDIRCNLVIGRDAALERLLVENSAITGEIVATVRGVWGASGLEHA